MPRKKLTDLFVERAKPPARGRIEYFDASFPGLALRVTKDGGKSWSVFYRFGGRLRRHTLGRYPAIKPAQARAAATAALERVRDGVDPGEEKRARRDQRTPEADTFGAASADYLKHVEANNRRSTFLGAKRDVEFDALKKWRKRPLASVSRRDVVDLIDRIVLRGAPVQANRTFARLRAFFNWAIEKDRLAASPIARMKLPTQEHARDRVLSDDELRWFWMACDQAGSPFGPLYKLLLLTGQRRDEVADMRWSEIDLERRVWTIPRHKAKNDREHEVQLSDAAAAVLRDLRRADDADLVFTTTGDTPVSGFSKSKHRLAGAMLKERRRSAGLPEKDGELRKALRIPAAKPLPVEIPDWRLHDLRRTAATGMARLNFAPHVVDKVLNHVSGTIRGVAAVYNRFAYLEERRAALEAWGRCVEQLVTPAPANVIALRR